jgi:hypothetical protein
MAAFDTEKDSPCHSDSDQNDEPALNMACHERRSDCVDSCDDVGEQSQSLCSDDDRSWPDDNDPCDPADHVSSVSLLSGSSDDI